MMHAIQAGGVEAKEQGSVATRGAKVVAEATSFRASLTSLTSPTGQKISAQTETVTTPVKSTAALPAKVEAESSAEPVVTVPVVAKAPVLVKALGVPVVTAVLPPAQNAVVTASGKPDKTSAQKKQPEDGTAKADDKSVEAAVPMTPVVAVAVPTLPPGDASTIKAVQEKVASAVSTGTATGRRAEVADPKKATGGKAAGVAAKTDAVATADATKSFATAHAEQASTAGASEAASTMVAVAPIVAPALSPNTVATPAREANGGHRGVSSDAGVDQAGSGAVGAGDTRTLVATPNVLEVGITGGAHGWLRVRAELGHTGEVTASLVASSAASAEALHKSLGAITDYLKSESVGVSSLAVTAPEKSSGAQAGATYNASAGGGSQGQTGSGGGSSQENPGGLEEVGGREERAGGLEVGSAGGSTSAMMSGGGGGWLSVRV